MKLSITFRCCFFLLSTSITLLHAGVVPLPSYPLAVRSPYLSAWLPGDQSLHAPTAQAQFWGGRNLTWVVLGRVDNTTYALFGAPKAIDGTSIPKQTSITFTSTHTLITLQAGVVTFSLDFFSPVSPKDLLRQSLPYSYLTVSAVASGGTSPTVEIFSAIDGIWTSQPGAATSYFQQYEETNIFALNVKNAYTFSQNGQMAAWGSTVFASSASKSEKSLSYQSGPAATVEAAFIDNGFLADTSPAITTGGLVAHAHQLGKITFSTGVTFAVGLHQEKAINYFDGRVGKNVVQTPYFRIKCPEITSSVTAFLRDYDAALEDSRSLDNQVARLGATISTNYTDLLEASVRQAFGAMQITVPHDTLNIDDTFVFLKEISSNGNVNTLFVIYPTFPILYILAPDYIRYLIQPYLIYLNSGYWPQSFAVHDLGDNYPNATAHNNGISENIYVEQTSALLTLIYAYQHATGDHAWAKGYEPLLRGYANYLVENGLYTASQRSTVDAIPASPNQTEIAITSTIGIAAFGAYSGNMSYAALAKERANLLYNQGLGTDSGRTHFKIHFADSDSTWITTFSLAPDKLLGLNTFDPAALSMQSAWYSQQIVPLGLPYASGINFIIDDWAIFSAAYSSIKVRDHLVNAVHAVLTGGYNNVPYPTKYNVKGSDLGEYIVNRARSTVGHNFILALNYSSKGLPPI